jgi:hypothetical protein
MVRYNADAVDPFRPLVGNRTKGAELAINILASCVSAVAASRRDCLSLSTAVSALPFGSCLSASSRYRGPISPSWQAGAVRLRVSTSIS